METRLTFSFLAVELVSPFIFLVNVCRALGTFPVFVHTDINENQIETKCGAMYLASKRLREEP